MSQRKYKGNLRFEKNRLIGSAMLADSTSIKLKLDSGCANGYANIDSVTSPTSSQNSPSTHSNTM